MAISAQQLKVSSVGRPVLKAPRPHVLPVFWANFFGRVYVINIQRPIVIKAAASAPAAEVLDKSQFTFPIPRVLVYSVSVLVPKSAHAFVGAKSISALFPASFARSVFAPSMRKVAGLAAKFGAFVFGDRIRAVGARIHGDSITKYFDIACRRIEDAQRQQRLLA